jgi:hypothetical protein
LLALGLVGVATVPHSLDGYVSWAVECDGVPPCARYGTRDSFHGVGLAEQEDWDAGMELIRQGVAVDCTCGAVAVVPPDEFAAGL